MKFNTNFLPILALLVIVACAGLTPAQQTLWALNVYDAQYQSYLNAVINPDLPDNVKEMLKEDPQQITGDMINPNLSEDRKRVLRLKKDILIELKPLVLMAAEYRKTGQLPTDDVQEKLTELINRLIELSED